MTMVFREPTNHAIECYLWLQEDGQRKKEMDNAASEHSALSLHNGDILVLEAPDSHEI